MAAPEVDSIRGHAKSALLDAAREALAEQGFAATSARAVCARSGANLRSIGYHYGSLRDLLVLALSTNFREWMAPLVADLTGERGAPDERLERGLGRLVGEIPDRAPLVAAWLEAVALSHRDPALRERLAGNRRTFRDALAATLAEGSAGDPEALADALMIVCDGLFTRYLMNGSIEPPRTIAATLAANLDKLAPCPHHQGAELARP